MGCSVNEVSEVHAMKSSCVESCAKGGARPFFIEFKHLEKLKLNVFWGANSFGLPLNL
jgi:hypothetical protein